MKTIYTLVTHEARKLPFYVTGIGLKTSQQHMKRPQGYPHYQIAYCPYGEGKFLIDGKAYDIRQGMGFFFMPELPHEYYATREPWGIQWVTFTGEQLQGPLDLLKLHAFEVFDDHAGGRMEEYFQALYAQVCSNEERAAAKCTATLFSMLIHLSDCLYGNSRPQHDKYQKLQPVLALMNRSYSAELTLEQLAGEINVSRHFLCRLFKDAYQTSPIRYLMQVRIQKAKQLIHESPNMRIKDIARQTGFRDTSYFCSVFKELEGVTPLEFRHNNLEGGHP